MLSSARVFMRGGAKPSRRKNGWSRSRRGDSQTGEVLELVQAGARARVEPCVLRGRWIGLS